MGASVPSPVPVVKHEWTNRAGCVGLGALHPVRVGLGGHHAADPESGVYCIFDGIIYAKDRTLGDGLVENNGAAVLLAHYLKSGADRLDAYNGSFVVAWWDEKAQRLVVANDKIGQRLLFFGGQNGMLAFSSLLARVMASGCVSPAIDLEGFADLIHFEHVIGHRTLFEHVQILPPASVLTCENAQVSIKRYWRIDEIEASEKYDARCLEHLTEVFKGAMRRALRTDMDVAIDLTGGLDSRCMLAAAVAADLPVVTHTGGQPDSTDVVLARQAAAMVGTKHIFEPVGPEKVAEWLTPMVLYQGGIVNTLHSHPCQHFEIELPFDAVLQGIGINYMRGLWGTSADFKKVTCRTAAENLLKHKMSSSVARMVNLEKLWSPRFKKLGLQIPDAHVRSLFSEYSSENGFFGILDAISLQERTRKFLNKGIMIVRGAREVYYPYLDHELLEALARLPADVRAKSRIQIDMIKRFAPELLSIRYAKNLIPLNASPTRIWGTLKYRNVKKRLSRHLGITAAGPMHVPAHYYSEWTRKEMRGVLVGLLFNRKAAFRAYLDWPMVESLLNQHFSGKTNWEHLVGALTVFEISHRLWVDPVVE